MRRRSLSRGDALRLRALQLAVVLALSCSVAAALARPGGGESFGGGSSGGGGGGGDAEIGILIDLLILCIHYPALGVPLLIVFALFAFAKYRHEKKNRGWSAGVPPNQVKSVARKPRGVSRSALSRIRSSDDAFSIALFEDFSYTLYAELHRSRARAAVGRLGPYLSAHVQQTIADPTLDAVHGIIIGSMRFVELHTKGDKLEVVAEFESNLTEVKNGQAARFYVVDRLTLQRSIHARSRPPARARTLDCPNCGAPLEAVRGNVCSYCREQVSDGRFDWTVTGIQLLRSEARPPLLFSNVDEQGTDAPTVVDHGARQRFGELCSRDPALSEPVLHARLALIFRELQVGWSEHNLARIRPFVSDNLFQYFSYWIDMYREARARNVSENARITRIDLANVLSDRFYDAVTLRVFATGLDYTLDQNGKLLKGSKKHERAYSEYWTLLRGSMARGTPRTEPVCPSCGAPLRISMAGNCEYCSAKVVSGDFDWVLSRIEQDESYTG